MQSLMTALRTKNGGQSVESRLNQSLEDVAILYRKKQWELALRVIRKEKRMALRYSYLNQFHSLLRLERQVVLSIFPRDSMEQMRQLRREESEALALLMRQSELDHLNFLARNMIRQNLHGSHGRNQQSFSEIAYRPAVEPALDSDDFLSFSYASNIRGMFFNVMQDYLAAIPVFSRVFDAWRESPGWIEERPTLFLSLFSNYQIAMLRGRKDTAVLEECLLFIRRFKLNDPVIKLMFENVSYQSGLVIQMNTARFEEAALLTLEIGHWLKKNATRLSDNVHLTFQYNAAVIHLMREDFVQSSRNVNRILAQSGKEARKDIRDFARLLQIILAIEQGEGEYAENLIHNAYQYLLRQEYSDFQKLTIEHLRRMIRTRSEGGRQAAQLEFLESLDQIAGEEPEKSPFGMMELRIWAEARSRGISLLQAFKEMQRGE